MTALFIFALPGHKLYRVMNMNNNRKTYAFWIILSEVTGLIAALLTRSATQQFSEITVQPPLSPPAILFPIVWTILYALMGFGAARIRLTPPSSERSRGINLFIAQLIVNLFWPLIFFNAQAYGFALIWLLLLWTLVLWMILTWRKIDPLAAKLQIPYLIWLTFAAYLNFGVWYLNR
jgi:tryptophan-rich sensory protein